MIVIISNTSLFINIFINKKNKINKINNNLLVIN